MKKEKEIGVTCERARSICIVKILAKLGHFPSRIAEKEAWFLSPLRSETQASFKVSLKLNRWYDHGLGKGGNGLDLIVAIKNFSVKQALEFLEDNCDSFSFQQPILKKRTASKIEVLRTREIEHEALTQYLAKREIPVKIAQPYCKEVWFSYSGKEYFAIGLENPLGGWELRNSYFKGSSSPKSYTYIKRKSKTLLITEGMFDFLSLAILEEDLVKASDIIILNSLAFTNKITGHLTNYENIRLYLDNDPAGDQATAKILKLFRSATDERNSFKNYKDLNEKLMQCKK
ncbi:MULTISPECIES: toprim domain-containing protein [Flavobacteriaceae]|uniref:Toprim domain-containing protein n=1 Tax=Christiangramia sediminis TaxID=2881336 RepID=A0A9X1RXU4_9FLAO|nr:MULTISPECIES: toprim domain-containing protein [Flavobacteriaceae]MCB7481791.1 toprim domain-containing protein [Christiangramia sediminis]WPY98840.1 toprim domain-containing protein [Christiangramia sp. OXR-203]